MGDAVLNNIILIEAIEAISEGFSLYDAEDKLIVCNSRYKELFASHVDALVPGTSFETILRTATERGLINDAEGRRDAWIEERLAHHHAPSETHVQRRSDGRWIHVSERKLASGGVVAIYADITEQIVAKNVIEKQKVHLDAALENISHGICMFDATQRLIVCNKRYADLYGLTNEETKPGTT